MSNKKVWLWLQFGGLLTLLVLLLYLINANTPSEKHLIRLLKQEGYQNPTLTGKVFFGCSGDSTYRESFKAEKNNSQINGLLCTNLYGATTIKLY